MTRYIDADSIEMPLFESKVDETWVRVAIDATPTADVQPVRHGHWEELRPYDVRCSVCGNSMMDKYPFCPECGSRMDE